MIDMVCGYRFKKTHRHGLCGAVIGILILISTVPALAAQPHLEPVTIQLRWFHQFQFAGYYAAIEKGFYTDEGLQVSLREFEPGKDRIAPVLEGKAQYGVGDPSLLKLRMQGKPVVVLAQIFQHSPAVLIARRESGIFSADELIGKRVMLPFEDIGSAAIQAMIRQEVGDLNRITLVSRTYHQEAFINGDVDAMSDYLSNEPYWLKARGVAVNIIDPRSYGIDFYGDNLYTAAKEVEEHPERVDKMIRATLKGWAYALEHKDDIIDLILTKYNPDLNHEHLRYEAKVIDQMIVADLVTLGDINTKRYDRIAETFHQLGMSTGSTVPDGFIYKAEPAPVVSLTAEEQAWLAAHPHITIGYTNAFEPNVIVNPDGTYRGIQVDILDELNRRLGTRIRLQVDPVREVIAKAQIKKIDGILSLHPDYADKLGLLKTRSYMDGYPAVFGKKNVAFRHPSDLAGKRVAVIDKIFFSEQIVIQHGPGATVLKVKNAKEGLQRIANGEADFFLGTTLNAYLLTKYQLFGLANQYVFFDQPINTVIGIRSDWPELSAILDKGLASFSKQEIERISAKWIQLAQPQKRIRLTAEEQAWLAEHGPRVRVSLVNLPPLQFEQDGEFTGYQVDILEAVLTRVGLQPVYTMDPFVNVYADLKEKKTEISLDFFRTEERAQVVLFSEKKFDVYVGIFARKERTDLNSIEALKNARIASHPGYGLEPKLKRLLPDAEIVHAVDPQGMFRLVSSGKADAVVHGLVSGEFMLQKNLILNVVSHGEFLAIGESRLQASEFVVRKDLPHLMSIIDKTYASIDEEEKRAIWNSWFGKDASKVKKSSILFADQELAWLAQDHTVQVRVVNFPPYIILKESGAPEGISIDYLKIITERTGVKFKYRFSGKTFPEALDGLIEHSGPDLIATMMQTPEREKSILFSKNYFRSPYVIFTHNKGETFISDMVDLNGKKIALVKGTVILAKIKKEFPDFKRVLFDNDSLAIEAVATEKADAYIGNLTLASFLILEKGLSGLKIAGPSPFGDHVLSMGIRNDWPELVSIMDKALATMSQAEHAKIRNKYIAIRYEHAERSAFIKWFAIISGAAFLVSLLFIFWNRQLAGMVRKRTAEISEKSDYLKSLTDSMPDAVYSVTLPDRKIEWANDTFKVLGYEADECVGRTTDFLYPSRQEYFALGEAMFGAIAEGKEVLRLDQTLRKKNGAVFPAEITISFFRVNGEVVSVTGIVRDISERRQREQRLQKYQERLKALASQLTVAEEKERRRIAADLHDHVGQALALARMQVATTKKRVTDAPMSAELDQISHTLYDALQDTRQLMFDLSPPSLNELGLSAAIVEWLETQIGQRYNIETAILDDFDDHFENKIEESVRAILFRNVRELLFNVVKHAQAKKVSVHLKSSKGRMKIAVQDDGVGFDPEAALQTGSLDGGFGLFSIQERMNDLGGSLEITSEPGKGCKATLTISVGENR